LAPREVKETQPGVNAYMLFFAFFIFLHTYLSQIRFNFEKLVNLIFFIFYLPSGHQIEMSKPCFAIFMPYHFNDKECLRKRGILKQPKISMTFCGRQKIAFVMR
jgi:hypothetical protein